MQCIVCWGPYRPGSGGSQPPSAGPATTNPQTSFKPPPMLLIWRWICYYPGQQTRVRNSL